MADLIMNGVRRSADRSLAAGPWAAVDLLREDLAHLERTLPPRDA